MIASYNPFSFDLHVLSTPPAFTLSQDQTLHKLLINLINHYVVYETDIFVFNYLITKLSLKFIDKLINISIYILFNFLLLTIIIFSLQRLLINFIHILKNSNFNPLVKLDGNYSAFFFFCQGVFINVGLNLGICGFFRFYTII